MSRLKGKGKGKGKGKQKKEEICETPLIITNEILGYPKLCEGEIISISYFEYSINKIIKTRGVVSRIWYYEEQPYYLIINIYNYKITIIDKNLKIISNETFSYFYTEIWNVYRIINMGAKKVLHIP